MPDCGENSISITEMGLCLYAALFRFRKKGQCLKRVRSIGKGDGLSGAERTVRHGEMAEELLYR